MKTIHYSIIVISFALVLILPSTVFATMLYNNDEVLKQFNINSTKMSKLVRDGAILITTQTMKKTEYKLGEKIIVHPILTNIGNKSMNIFYMWHPFFFVVNDQNGYAVWANGPSVPMMEYSSNLNQTIEPNMSFTGGIHDVADPRHPVILNNPGNYTISSVADFYDDQGNPRHLVWSEPIKFTVLPEKYSVADMNMLPPLQQFLGGIPAINVKCNDGLELLIKTNTGLPICAKPHTATKLIERGWAKKTPSQIPIVIMPPGFDDSQSGKTYDPSSISVVIGINNTVRWTNKASSSDTLTSDGFKESNSFGEIFGGSTLGPGDTYEFTFTNAGTFGYHGVPHSWNKGKVTVLQPSGSVEDDDMQRILSVCSNPDVVKKGNDVFVICQHPKNSTGNVIFNLPLPEYKRTVCQSTHGCSGVYNYVPQIPDNLLSSKQQQEAIDKVLQDTGLKDHYPDIQLDHFIILANNDKWSADVQFIIPHIMNGYKHCGWYTSTQIDLQTFEVSPLGVPIGTQKC